VTLDSTVVVAPVATSENRRDPSVRSPLIIPTTAVPVAISLAPYLAAPMEGAGEGFTAELGIGGGSLGLTERGGIRHDASAFVLRGGIGTFVDPRAAVGVRTMFVGYAWQKR